jgi:flagellar biosynthesis anti-sigma factor FlgM
MKIDNLNKLENAGQSRSANRVTTDRASKSDSASQSVTAIPPPAPDTVYISDLAETLAKLVTRVKELPDIRQERVDSLRPIATSGAFHPTAEEVADSIIREEAKFSR